jgi:hypothetical protein
VERLTEHTRSLALQDLVLSDRRPPTPLATPPPPATHPPTHHPLPPHPSLSPTPTRPPATLSPPPDFPTLTHSPSPTPHPTSAPLALGEVSPPPRAARRCTTRRPGRWPRSGNRAGPGRAGPGRARVTGPRDGCGGGRSMLTDHLPPVLEHRIAAARAMVRPAARPAPHAPSSPRPPSRPALPLRARSRTSPAWRRRARQAGLAALPTACRPIVAPPPPVSGPARLARL